MGCKYEVDEKYCTGQWNECMSGTGEGRRSHREHRGIRAQQFLFCLISSSVTPSSSGYCDVQRTCLSNSYQALQHTHTHKQYDPHSGPSLRKVSTVWVHDNKTVLFDAFLFQYRSVTVICLFICCRGFMLRLMA